MYIPKSIHSIVLLYLMLSLCFASFAQPNQEDSVPDNQQISQSGFTDFMKQDSVENKADRQIGNLRKTSSYRAADSFSDEYNRAALRYNMESFDHRHRVFEWQLSSSKYIFFVVIIIVLVGLMLSVWQFYLPVYRMNKTMKGNDVTRAVSQTIIENAEKTETQVSTIKLGKDGVEITSPVIGLLILAISIAFFFLYIRYVYPISEISHSQVETAASPK